MTDSLAALALLADSEHVQRPLVLADFESRWRTDALVMDKWFGVQAQSLRSDTLEQVQRLMQHPSFRLDNPNKVRALIGNFCSANPLRFHAADGSGYSFLVDQVLKLDNANPQVAARLLRVLSRWRRHVPGRRVLMRQQLERVLAKEGLSRDLHEVAKTSLE
jgi:aminopeptidase N